MSQQSISELFARNLAAAMSEANDGRGISQNALAGLSGVPQTTIGLMLRPEARQHPDGRALPGPTLERMAMVAKALGCPMWELLHPDRDKARRERLLYEKIESEYRKLQAGQAPNNTPAPAAVFSLDKERGKGPPARHALSHHGRKAGGKR